MFKVEKITGYNCPSKYLATQDDTPLFFVNSRSHASECIQYIQGLVSEDNIKNNDAKILVVLREARKRYLIEQASVKDNGEPYSLIIKGVKKEDKLLSELSYENLSIDELKDISLKISGIVSSMITDVKYGTRECNIVDPEYYDTIDGVSTEWLDILFEKELGINLHIPKCISNKESQDLLIPGGIKQCDGYNSIETPGKFTEASRADDIGGIYNSDRSDDF